MASRQSKTPKYYCDENFPYVSIGQLRKIGINLVHAKDYGLVGKKISDIRQIRKAAVLKRVLLTLDQRLISRVKEMNLTKYPGIVVLTPPSTRPEEVERVASKMLQKLSEKTVKGHLLTISSKQIRKIV